jgi:hypothetical protein
MYRLILPILLLGLVAATSAERKNNLPEKLKEISGWVFVNDSTLIAHNDSGNGPILYVLNLNGTIRKETFVKGTKCVDYEDITADDKGNVYLGDFGNNDNKRQNLAIWKIRASDILRKDSVTAQEIAFSYPEQKTFPAAEKEMYYDCEAMGFYKDSLYVFTKCRAVPFDGKCMVYSIPAEPGTYKAKKKTHLVLGKRSWMLDSATAAAFYKDELFIQTYTKMHIFTVGADRKLTAKNQFSMPVTQKEAIAVRSNGDVYVGDEKAKEILGGKMQIFTQQEVKKKK